LNRQECQGRQGLETAVPGGRNLTQRHKDTKKKRHTGDRRPGGKGRDECHLVLHVAGRGSRVTCRAVALAKADAGCVSVAFVLCAHRGLAERVGKDVA